MKTCVKFKKLANLFSCDNKGNITVMFVILLPVILWCLFFFESKMQARWVYVQTQSILDFATLGGAQTGQVETVAGGTEDYVCSIPYDTSNPTQSGQHVTEYLLRENVQTLPDYVAESILTELDNGRIEGLTDYDIQRAGFMRLRVNFKYTPRIPVLFNQYSLTVESTSKCTVKR